MEHFNKVLVTGIILLVLIFLGWLYIFRVSRESDSISLEQPASAPIISETPELNSAVVPDKLGAENEPAHPDGNPDFPNFPQGNLSSEIPHDVDNIFEENADEQNRQRLFDILSWQSFIGLNWPVDRKGKATEHIIDLDQAAPRWTTWKLSSEVFKEDGGTPEPWGTHDFALPATVDKGCQGSIKKYLFNLDVISRDRGNLLDTSMQPDGKRLWDQNGHLVYYEILMNQVEYDFIKENQLYNLNGQIEFFKRTILYFPTGRYWDQQGSKLIKDTNPKNGGVMEVKLAWKVIDGDDIPGRFYTQPACVIDNNGNWQERVVGLVGMHISHRTFSSAKWVWSTFEQVDNLQVDPQAVAEYKKQDKVLKPSFYDPNCGDCQPNTVTVQDGITKTQVVRVIPITEDANQLNGQVQKLLGQQGSVWQYYQLIGTQWTPAPGDPGQPNPIPNHLVNSVMETYIDLDKDPPSCMNCHYFAQVAEGVEMGDNGTKVIKEGGPGSADFSFLLGKAHWKE